MFFTGHLATVYLLGHRIKATRGLSPGGMRALMWPCAFGVLLPDLIDKPLLLAGWTPQGRTLGHSLGLWFLACALCALWQQRRWPGRWALSWVSIGWGLHLGGDLVEAGVVGLLWGTPMVTSWWMWPWADADLWMWPPLPWVRQATVGRAVVDAAGVGGALGVWVVQRRRNWRAGGRGAGCKGRADLPFSK